jgi:hypothetical protein
VPAIGKQDPKKVKSASLEIYGTNPELLDAMLAGAGDEGSASGANATEKKGKRRKA